jgi:penicillin-binding protein 2
MQDNRKWVIIGLFSLIGVIFLVKLFMIQVMSDDFRRKAEAISIKSIVDYPHRGIILDRNGKELVVNAPVYDLMVIPKQVQMKDTLAFCETIGISIDDFRKSWKKACDFALERPSIFLKQISRDNLHNFQDQLSDYPGFYINARTVRNYPHENAAHVLGYIGEIDERGLERDATGYYKAGDYIGISGVEAAYEKELRGQKGVRHVWVDNWGREKGSFKDGQFDTLAVAGKNLISSIDLDLQKFAEELMVNKKGAVVAIEPSTGEILAMVAAPTYDPNLLTGKEASGNFGKLLLDENKPLFNRAVRAAYPPGSTFKTVQALIGMQENVINSQTVFPCNKGLVKCHFHPTTDLQRSIQHSCNPYYYQVFRRIIYQNKLTQHDSTFSVGKDLDYREGFTIWKKYLDAFNLGRKINVDLVSEVPASIPGLSLYDDRYGKGNWKFSNIYSLGIGQGEVLTTPLQLANVAATLANRGYYYTPHLVKSIGNEKSIHPEFTTKHTVPINTEYFEIIVAGMRDAYRAGTVASYAINPDLEICGKTGTAQNPHGEDHSVFIAFAPKDNPKIAIAVYVENAGFGGVWAAPVAALAIEKYLKGKTSKRLEWTKDYVIKKRFILEPQPEPTDSSEVPEKPAPAPKKVDTVRIALKEDKPNQRSEK